MQRLLTMLLRAGCFWLALCAFAFMARAHDVGLQAHLASPSGTRPQDSAVPSSKPSLYFRSVLKGEVEKLGTVQAIVQDRHGFIWLGGQNGLLRYDGYNHVLYQYDSERMKLPANSVHELTLDSSGRLWMATDSGLIEYQEETETLQLYQFAEGPIKVIRRNFINALHIARNGRIWVGGPMGLMEFIPERKAFEPYAFEIYPKLGGKSQVLDIAEDSRGDLWIAMETSGLVQFNPETGDIKRHQHDAARSDQNQLLSNHIHRLMVDSQERLWIVNKREGVQRLDLISQRYESLETPLKVHSVWGLLEDSEKRVWIGNAAGLSFWDEAERRFVDYRPTEDPRSINHINVRTLFQDRDNNIWIGFYPAGLDVVDKSFGVFEVVYEVGTDNMRTNRIYNFDATPAGDVIVGTGLGMRTLDFRTKTLVPLRNVSPQYDITNKANISVLSLNEHEMLGGTWAGGLHRVNQKTGAVQTFLDDGKPGGLVGNQPWDILKTDNGEIWLTTNKGLNAFDPSTGTFEYFRPSEDVLEQSKAFYCRVLIEDKKGQIWVGSDKGLFIFDRTKKTFRAYPVGEEANKLSAVFAMSLYESKDGSIWVGMRYGGLNRIFPNGVIEKYSKKDGLPDDSVTGIVEDEHGFVWVTTYGGIARIDPKNRKIKPFYLHNGIAGNLHNKNAAFELASGVLLFGSTDGITIVHPELLGAREAAPETVITGLYVMNVRHVGVGDQTIIDQVILDEDQIELRHDNAVFGLTFATFDYSAGSEIEFEYLLDGYDHGWQTIKKGAQANYVNVPPGQYDFFVRAVADGERSDQVKQLSVIVHPPLWRTWWAYTLYFCLMVLLVYGVVISISRKSQYRVALAKAEHLKGVDKLKDEFLACTAHELRTPLNGIIGLSSNLMDLMENDPPKDVVNQYVETIDYSARRLAHLVNDILDYSKLKHHVLHLNSDTVNLFRFVESLKRLIEPLIKTKNLEFVNNINPEMNSFTADEKRLQQIFFNIVGNSIKFTEEGQIVVSAVMKYDKVIVSFKDSGIGIPADKLKYVFESYEQVIDQDKPNYGGTGLGLSITKQLVELHGGEVWVESEEGVGTTFFVSLPVNH